MLSLKSPNKGSLFFFKGGDTAMPMFISIIVSAICIIIGFIIGFKKKRPPIGTLRIDRSDPYDKPYLFLEMDVNPDKLLHYKYVTFKVNTESYISRK